MSKAYRFLAVLTGVAFVGCGNPDRYEREPLEGTVYFRGEPIPHANVLFSGENGPTEFDTGSLVLNGRYQIGRDFGLPPGRYRARISFLEPDKSGGKEAVVQFPGEEGDVKLRQVIPPPFSTEGIIVEVVAGKPNVFNFDIP